MNKELADCQSTSSDEDPFFAMMRQKYERDVQRYNAQEGHLNEIDGIECPICKNKGMTEVLIEEPHLTTWLKECECMKARKAYMNMKQSGLEDAIKRCTFDSFEQDKPYQRGMLEVAQNFLNGNGSRWLFYGGQVGCGKTHICTAVCGELLRRGKEVQYMLWKDESTRLKAEINDEEAYTNDVNKLKNIEVLYIDDLFKSNRNQPPTTADVNLAFEIINFRYVNKDKITIISSELAIDDLIAIDEAVGSRIYEMSKNSTVEVGKDPAKNYRMKERFEA